LADTAFVMRLEKNADVTPMECYAPLLVNVNPGAAQWNTNLIGYDALHSFGSPSYYAQVMLGQNKGDVVLPATLELPKSDAGAPPVFASATYMNDSHTAILKIVNLGETPVDLAINLRGAGNVNATGTAIVLCGDPKGQNTVDEPTKFSPKEEPLANASASFHRTFPPYSFTLIRLMASPK
jgi:alpha-N-arabinofuranosidase